MMEGRLSWYLRAFAAAAIVFLLLPVAVVVLASFSATDYLTIPPQGLTLRWFGEVLADPDYLAAIGFSLELAGVATLVATLLAVPACYALHHRWVPLAGGVSAFLLSPLIFPGVVIGVALLQYMSVIGLRGNFAILALAHVVIVTPYVVRTMLAGLSGVDPALEEAARVLGAGRTMAFLLVVAPLLRTSMLAGVIFAFITSFDEATVTLFLLPPGQATLPVKIFSAIDLGVDPSIAAISTLMIAATIALLALAERLGGMRRLV